MRLQKGNRLLRFAIQKLVQVQHFRADVLGAEVKAYEQVARPVYGSIVMQARAYRASL